MSAPNELRRYSKQLGISEVMDGGGWVVVVHECSSHVVVVGGSSGKLRALTIWYGAQNNSNICEGTLRIILLSCEMASFTCTAEN